MDVMRFEVFGVSVEIKAADDEFIGFVSHNYRSFKSNSEISLANVTVNFSPEAGRVARENSVNLSSVGKGLKVGDGDVYWENEFGFTIYLQIVNKRIHIWAYHFDLLSGKEKEERYKNYQRSMRWAIHFPVFWLLEREQGMSLVHASAVSLGDKTLVFCGLNSVGKSSLALYFVQKYGFQFMTDNFLLVDRHKIYGFPERVRVSPEVGEKLGLHDYLKTADFIYGKFQFNLQPNEINLVSKPTYVFILLGGKPLQFIPLSRARASRIISGIHDYLQEFPRYSFYAMLNFIDEETIISVDNTFFSSSCQFALLRNPMDWDFEKIGNEVLNYVN